MPGLSRPVPRDRGELSFILRSYYSALKILTGFTTASTFDRDSDNVTVQLEINSFSYIRSEDIKFYT